MLLPPHYVHELLRCWCLAAALSQMLLPPHALHLLLCRWCSQISLQPQSLHLLDLQMLAPELRPGTWCRLSSGISTPPSCTRPSSFFCLLAVANSVLFLQSTCCCCCSSLSRNGVRSGLCLLLESCDALAMPSCFLWTWVCKCFIYAQPIYKRVYSPLRITVKRKRQKDFAAVATCRVCVNELNKKIAACHSGRKLALMNSSCLPSNSRGYMHDYGYPA